MKKLLLTLIAAFAICISTNAQAAKTKKQTANLTELTAKAEAEKKAKYDEMQKRKMQIELDAQKAKVAPKQKL